MDDYLWWLLFNYDNVPREKQIAFALSAMGGIAVGATIAGVAWALRRAKA